MTEQNISFRIAGLKARIDRAYDSYYTLVSLGDDERAAKVAVFVEEREQELEALLAEREEMEVNA